MKKAIALFLAAIMTVSLTACGGSFQVELENNNEGTTTTETTTIITEAGADDEVSTTTTEKKQEQKTTKKTTKKTTAVTTTKKTTTAKTTATTKKTTTTTKKKPATTVTTKPNSGLQGVYEDYFLNGKAKVAGNCISTEEDGVKMAFNFAGNGDSEMLIKVKENVLRIYRNKSGKEYVYVKFSGKDENGNVVSENAWFEYKPKDTQSGSMLDQMQEDMNISEALFNPENITFVKYINSSNGVDRVEVDIKNEDGGNDIWLVSVDTKTQKITEMVQSINEFTSTVKFYNINKIDDVDSIPSKLEVMNEEQFMGSFIAVLFSAME